MDQNENPKMYCYNHPQRETLLRCNRCERPICSECAVLTPTGYRCRECVRNQQKTFDTAGVTDLLVGGGIAVVLSFIGSYIATFLGFFAIFLAPVAGFIIAEVIRWAVHRRRSRRLFQVCTWAAVAGSLPLLLINLVGVLAFLTGGSVLGLLSLAYQGFYTFAVASAVHYRLSGIQLGR